ncbi:MAG TPA: cyclic nucleotide-binding domain-containing protein [Reyranella sp.]|jgi:CRP-like cAMP-binding protein
MSEGDLFGYFASFLVFSTFYMRRMVPLRLTAIASNVAFISYAWLGHLTPILILHGALLPLNLFRLVELRRLVAKVVKASTEQFSIDPLLPLMQRRVISEKDVLFKADDPAHALFYVLEGTLHLPEIDKELGPGSIIGEFALFSDTGRRTATAVAKTDCIVMSLTKAAVFSALVQHPQLGIHLLRMVTVRMLENANRHSSTWPPVKADGAGEEITVPVRRRMVP